MRRRSRIGPAAFAAGLLIALIIALWTVHIGLWSPDVEPTKADRETPEPVYKPDPLPSQQEPPVDVPKPVPEQVPLPTERLPSPPPSEAWGGFPEWRVRQVRPESQPPDELYEQNRVIIRKANVMRTMRGLQITGEVLTDFELDAAPFGFKLPPGQLMGLKLHVELYYYETVLDHDPQSDAPREPRVDPRQIGRLVEGQMAEATVTTQFGRFGLARFALPELDKPLAPGLYRLIARLNFKTQKHDLWQAIEWCSDLYGARVDFDEVTLQPTWRSVMDDPFLHEEVFRYLVETKGELSDEARIWVGDIRNGEHIELVPPESATSTTPANFVVWAYHHVVVEQVRALENQLDNVDAVIDAELEKKLRAQPPANANAAAVQKLEDLKRKWIRQADEDKQRIRRDNGDLITKYGGRITPDEREMLEAAEAAQKAVLRQISGFQDRLALRYWSMVDGCLTYTGFHRINHPAWLAWDAIDKRDNGAAAIQRIDKLRAVQNTPGGLAAKWEARREQWKYCPPDLTEAAFEYLRTKEETDEFDPVHFTEKSGGRILFLPHKWRDMRYEFIETFAPDSEKRLALLDTSRTYAVLVWKDAWQNCQAARDDVLRVSFSWEHYIRTEQMAETRDVVLQDWELQNYLRPELKLSDYYTGATNAPGTLRNRFDSEVAAVREFINVREFMTRYARAIQEGTTPPGQR
ncbi:MAG: hypothetical protein H6839_05455 [Planctomycetes bacterium]|nr:hypothetical protein [Planctomycetota bacterium]